MSRQPNRPKFTTELAPPSDGQPKGKHLRESLERLIKDLEPGVMLPSERVLAEQFGVARMTVRQQLDALAAVGRVSRVIGSGTYSAEPKLAQTQEFSSFSQEIEKLGMTPHSQVVSTNVIPADTALAGRLEIPPLSPVLQLARVRTADGVPFSVERTNLPLIRFPGLDDVQLGSRSLYKYLRDTYDCEIRSAEHRYSVAIVDAEDAVLLNVTSGSPVFLADVVVRSADNRVVEVGQAVLRGDRYEVKMRSEMAREAD